MFFPIPFYTCFLKGISERDQDDKTCNSENGSISSRQFYIEKFSTNVDASSTQDETDATSITWEQSSKPRRRHSITVEEAEQYTNYVETESMAETIRLLPFVSIDLHEAAEHSEASSVPEECQEGKAEVESGEVWWGGMADGIVVASSSQTVGLCLDMASSFENDSFSSQDLANSDESSIYQPRPVPTEISFCTDDIDALDSDDWLFDPVDTLVQGRIPLHSDNDEKYDACTEVQQLLSANPESLLFKENVAMICEIVRYHPHVAQVRYRPPNQPESRMDSSFCSVGSVSTMLPQPVEVFSGTPCYLLTIFAALGDLEAMQACYAAYPEAIGYVDKRLGNALHYACSNVFNVDLVRFLLDRYPEAARVTNRKYQSPLHIACSMPSSNRHGARTSQIEAVKLLLAVFPTAARLADENGYTPMHLACKFGASAEILVTLEQSSSGVIEARTQNMEKPLHAAASHRSGLEAVRFLLQEYPSQAAAIDNMMQTPLHKACLAPTISLQIVQLLLKAYPQALTMSDNNVERPYDLALRMGSASPMVLQLLDP